MHAPPWLSDLLIDVARANYILSGLVVALAACRLGVSKNIKP